MLHKLKTEDLKSIALEEGQALTAKIIDDWTREHLTSNIRIMQRWKLMDVAKLKVEAQLQGIQRLPSEEREEITRLLEEQCFGLPGTAPRAASMPPQPSMQTCSATAPASSSLRSSPQVVSGTQSASTQAQQAPSKEHTSEDFAQEVKRINYVSDAGSDMQALGLDPADKPSSALVKRRYKELMLVLHPDKRKAEGERLAGGKQVCDRAFQRIQKVKENLDNQQKLHVSDVPSWMPAYSAQPMRPRTAASPQPASTPAAPPPQPRPAPSGAPDRLPSPPPPPGPPPADLVRPMPPPAPHCSIRFMIEVD